MTLDDIRNSAGIPLSTSSSSPRPLPGRLYEERLKTIDRDNPDLQPKERRFVRFNVILVLFLVLRQDVRKDIGNLPR
jgi:hypothetical protein